MIVDDHPVFLDVARTLIEMTPGFEAVAEARSGREALDLVAAAEPDLVMLDVRMAELDGIETARRLHADYPAMIVLLVSSDLDAIEPLARSCGATALARKQDLRPRLLRRLWATHRPRPFPPAHPQRR
jgi:DNA-binding NarL/FixJ family response regulator